MAKVKLVPATRYDGTAAYDVTVDGVKVAQVYRNEYVTPILSGRIAVGYRRRMVWRMADRIRRHGDGEWVYASGLVWPTRQRAVDFIVKIVTGA